MRGEKIELPKPRSEGMALEQALAARRSSRSLQSTPISLADVSQLLWAAQGVTDFHGLRTAPSAGALYPLELYLVAGAIEGLGPGVYKYVAQGHHAVVVCTVDVRSDLAEAALGQAWVRRNAMVVAICSVAARTTRKYGRRGVQYVHMEAGHAAQNLFLQAVSLNLHTVVVGAFDDDLIRKVLGLPEDETPLCLMPVGR